MAITELNLIRNTLYSRQWEVDGSKGNKYIVSLKDSYAHEGIHRNMEWCCACKAWTSTSPRQDCKHILQVKLFLIDRERTGVSALLPDGVCPNCGGEGPLGRFVKTGQSGFGDVEGYTCTHEYHQLQRKLNPNWAKIVDTPAPIKRRIKI